MIECRRSYDGDLAHPQFKTERDSVATGGIKCGAGSEFATAVYKKRYIREQIHNHDRTLAHPPYPFKEEHLPSNLAPGSIAIVL